jgi:hypothetical protein
LRLFLYYRRCVISKRFTDTEKWKDQWFRKLPTKYKAFWFYIVDNCDNSGLWKQDIDLASFQIGEKIDLKDAIKFLNNEKERVKVVNNGEYLLIYTFISFQIGNIYQEKLTNLQKNAKKLMLQHIETKGLIVKDFNVLTGKLPVAMRYIYKGIKDKGKEDTVTGKLPVTKSKEIPPDFEDVESYCKEIEFDLDIQHWLDFYQSKGWLIGKNKMKDWKAAVRTWKRNNYQTTKPKTQQGDKISWNN